MASFCSFTAAAAGKNALTFKPMGAEGLAGMMVELGEEVNTGTESLFNVLRELLGAGVTFTLLAAASA